ncbi:MAG: dihydroorotase [Oscillospiraceae bacterium]|nr:dihydroorotase [Oscillospiraceae bacterium]
MKVLIKNGRVLNPATEFDGIIDIFIEDDRISKVQENITDEADVTIDASNKLVMPGFVDIHVHFRDPGFEYKEDIITGSRAAARGGVTTVCAMPNTKPAMDNTQTLQYVLDKAKNSAVIDVMQVSAITKGQDGAELVDMEAMFNIGAIAFSEDGKSIMDINLYKESLKKAAKMGALVMAHCEDKDLVGKGVLNEGAASKKYNVDGISNSVEDVITARDIFLAKEAGAKLHISHCSTEGSLALVKMGKELGADVTVEVSPHHFILSDEDIVTADSNFKMNPPLRSKKDVNAMIQGFRDGTIDAIATDHAPHSREEKALGFSESPVGVVGIETSASLTYTALVETGVISSLEMARKMSYNPAKIIGKQETIGDISVGKYADIVIFDPDKEYAIDVEEFASKSINSPFAGKKVKGKVANTIFRGKVVYDEQK